MDPVLDPYSAWEPSWLDLPGVVCGAPGVESVICDPPDDIPERPSRRIGFGLHSEPVKPKRKRRRRG